MSAVSSAIHSWPEQQRFSAFGFVSTAHASLPHMFRASGDRRLAFVLQSV
jgi:hypothetical protein